jgi:archaellum component FlaC
MAKSAWRYLLSNPFAGMTKRFIPESFWGRAAMGAGAIAVGGVALYITPMAPVAVTLAGAAIGAVGMGATAGAVERQIKFKKLGIDPPVILQKREKDVEVDGRKRAVFTFEDVVIINEDAIVASIEALASGEASTHTFNGKTRYSVEIQSRTDITLGELDYLNLLDDGSDLVVKVTMKEGGAPVEGDEREEVLRTLGMIPKFLNDDSSGPIDIATEVIGEASESRRWDWIRTNVLRQGRIRRKIDPIKHPHHKLETEEFIGELVEVGIATGKYRKIFDGYERVLKESHLKAYYQEERVLREKHRLAGDGGITSLAVTTAHIALFAIGAVASVVVLAFCFGILASGAAAPLVAGFAGLGFAASVIVGSSSVFGFLRKLGTYKYGKSLKKAQVNRDKKTEESKGKFERLKLTIKEIQKCVTEKSKQLSFAGDKAKLDDVCAEVVSKWLYSSVGRDCTTLNLSENNITSVGAAKLAKVLVSSSRIQEIDLSGNPIGVDGVEIIKGALSENFTLTEFKYSKGVVTEDTSQDIERQLLINQYLQGVRDSDGKVILGNGFKNEAEFFEAAIKKIQKAQHLHCIQAAESIISNFESLDERVAEVFIQKQLELMFDGGYPENKRLEAYAAIYNEKTSQYFSESNKKDSLELIKKAIFAGRRHNLLFGSSGMDALINMDGASRIDLLAQCALLTDIKSTKAVVEDNKSHVYGIASIASELIMLCGEKNLALPEEMVGCMQQICTWGVGSASSATRWNFDNYITKLTALKKGFSEKLRDAETNKAHLESEVKRIRKLYAGDEEVARAAKMAELAVTELVSMKKIGEKLEGVIQAGLQADLKQFLFSDPPQHSTHRIREGVGQSTVLDGLKERLAGCYDLTQFDDIDSIEDRDIRGYISYICDRNLLHKYAKERDLSNFMRVYSAMPIPDEDGRNPFLPEDSADILQTIQPDLAEEQALTCEELRKLDESHRIVLFNHCFATSTSADRKAVLLSKMLDIYFSLFKEQDRQQKLPKELSKIIYCGISTGRHSRRAVPYYDLKRLEEELGKVLVRITENSLGGLGGKDIYPDISFDLQYEVGEAIAQVLSGVGSEMDVQFLGASLAKALHVEPSMPVATEHPNKKEVRPTIKR